jgi:hypothetical protein
MTQLFIWALFGIPALAFVFVAVCLFVPEERAAALFGVMGALLGFCAGAALGGGFGQTEGWGWGNVGALFLGIGYAGAGCFAAAGLYWLFQKWWLGLVALLVAAVFPACHLGLLVIEPAVTKAVADSQMEYWRPILTNGYLSSSEDDAREHLSSGTREELKNYIGQHSASGTATPPIPPSTLKLLYDLGIGEVVSYSPLPPDLAREMYAKNPRSYTLARNPSTPEDILLKVADSNEQSLLLELARNERLPDSVVRKLDQRYEKQIAEESKKADPDYYIINTAKDGLTSLVRNPSTPVDLLQKLADSDDPNFLYEMTFNQRLPDSVAEKVRQHCEQALAAESQKPKPDKSKIFIAKRALEILDRRSAPH